MDLQEKNRRKSLKRNSEIINATIPNGIVAKSVQHRACNKEVVGSCHGWAHSVKTLGGFSHLCASVTKQCKLVLA